MFEINKLFKIIFFLLILITIGEIGYYLYIQSIKVEITPKNDYANRIVIPQIGNALKNGKEPTPTINQNQAINDQYLKTLRNLDKNLVVSSILTTKYQGQIITIDTKGGILPSNNFKYQIKLGIQAKDSKNTFFFSDKELNLIKVVKNVDNKETSIKIDGLAMGDNIFVEETVDATKDADTNLIGIKISKL